MRRVLGINLIVLLVLPWIVAIGGTAPGVVPCPMHRTSEEAARPWTGGATPGHQSGAEHSGRSHHESTGHGCNCASECGSSGVAFGLPAIAHLPIASGAVTESLFVPDLPSLVASDRLLPFSTGPPQRLRA
jgi:hypothetical protein